MKNTLIVLYLAVVALNAASISLGNLGPLLSALYCLNIALFGILIGMRLQRD